MTIKISYELDQECTRVPYGPLRDTLRDNRGFTDLRGRPDEAARITEGAQSTALKGLLIGLAQPSSYLFSLGCDLGAHREKQGPKRRRDAAGGYIQVASTAFADRKPEDYRRLAEAAASAMKEKSSGRDWELTFVLKGVELGLDNYGKIVPSVWIWFSARASKPEEALLSREALLEALAGVLASDACIDALKPPQTSK